MYHQKVAQEITHHDLKQIQTSYTAQVQSQQA